MYLHKYCVLYLHFLNFFVNTLLFTIFATDETRCEFSAENDQRGKKTVFKIRFYTNLFALRCFVNTRQNDLSEQLLRKTHERIISN